MLKIPYQLSGAFHSFKEIPSLLFFSLLNCKYQVPFILLFLLLLYCSCNFFFSLVDRRSSGRIVYSQSQSVNTISFQSLVQEGKTEQNVSFLFSLPSSHSLLLPCIPINVVMTALFIVLYLWGSWVLFVSTYSRKKT